jgi:hypothetical protein
MNNVLNKEVVVAIGNNIVTHYITIIFLQRSTVSIANDVYRVIHIIIEINLNEIFSY